MSDLKDIDEVKNDAKQLSTSEQNVGSYETSEIQNISPVGSSSGDNLGPGIQVLVDREIAQDTDEQSIAVQLYTNKNCETSVQQESACVEPSSHSQNCNASGDVESLQTTVFAANHEIRSKGNLEVPVTDASSNKTSNNDNIFLKRLKRELTTYFEPEMFKRSKIDLYAEDSGPKFYNIKGNNITPPLIPYNLPETFKYLPIFGRPKTKANLKEFLETKVKEFVGSDLNNHEFQLLSHYCCPSKLKTGKELVMPSKLPGAGLLPTDLFQDSDDSGDELCTVKKYNLRVKLDTNNVYQKKFKYRGLRMLPLPQDDYYSSFEESPLQPGKDLLFHVRIYRPFSYNPLEKPRKGRHSLFSCELVVLGRQTLATLRDRFACANDVGMRVDVSHRPYEPPATSCKDVFPSGFLFVNNVFYVDQRAGCSDTSAPVREWAARTGLGDFHCRSMDVRLDRLPLRLGHPDVYVHQGSCEHLFTFSDVRLLTATDPLDETQYPCHRSVGQNQSVYCTTCAEFGAKWVVVGCMRVPFSPAFFCETCFKKYLYKDNQKIGDFTAYSYRGNELNILRPQAQPLSLERAVAAAATTP